jgi:S1-C subfamily serine protease
MSSFDQTGGEPNHDKEPRPGATPEPREEGAPTPPPPEAERAWPWQRPASEHGASAWPGGPAPGAGAGGPGGTGSGGGSTGEPSGGAWEATSPIPPVPVPVPRGAAPEARTGPLPIGSGPGGTYGHGSGASSGGSSWGRGRRIAGLPLLVIALTAVLSAAIGGGVVAATRHTTTLTAGPVAVSNAPVPAAQTTSDARSAIAKIKSSIVLINTTVNGSFGRTGSGAGTGIIVTSAGEVVTNAHVVQDASSIRVTVPGHGPVTATVEGSDANADLALLRLQGLSGLPAATFAGTSTVNVGDPVLAIGNAEGYGGTPTVTEGIISALNRSLPADSTDASGALHGLIQTDAAINPGNSGGALVDTAGRVIGITTAIAAGDRGQPAQNIGFAITSDTVTSAIPGLRAGRNVAPNSGGSGATANRAFLGLQLQDTGGQGAQVADVESGTPADRAGLAAGDVITNADGTRITSASDLQAVLAKHKPGDKVTITWQQGGQNGPTHSATVTLATRPSNTG